MNISRILKFMPALLFMAFVAACGGDNPTSPDNGNDGDDRPIEDISASDFIGAWVDEDDRDLYVILESDRSGIIIEIGTNNGKPVTEESEIVWKYRNNTLTIDGEDLTVIKVTTRSMTLMDEDGDMYDYRRIKKSEIPGYDDDGDDDDNGSNAKSGLSSLVGIQAQLYYQKTLEDEVINLKYDEKCRVIQYEDGYGYTITYSYGVNEIVKKEIHKSRDSWQSDTYKLSKGRISQITTIANNMAGVSYTRESTISYNKNKVAHIQETTNNGITEYNFSWNADGDISETTHKSDYSRIFSKTTYTYDSSETFMPQIHPYGCESDYYEAMLEPFLWIEGYFGDIPKHIMTSKYVSTSYDGVKFSGHRQVNINTTKDYNGRISRQVIRDKYLEDNETQINIIQFYWE